MKIALLMKFACELTRSNYLFFRSITSIDVSLPLACLALQYAPDIISTSHQPWEHTHHLSCRRPPVQSTDVQQRRAGGAGGGANDNNTTIICSWTFMVFEFRFRDLFRTAPVQPTSNRDKLRHQNYISRDQYSNELLEV